MLGELRRLPRNDLPATGRRRANAAVSKRNGSSHSPMLPSACNRTVAFGPSLSIVLTHFLGEPTCELACTRFGLTAS